MNFSRPFLIFRVFPSFPLLWCAAVRTELDQRVGLTVQCLCLMWGRPTVQLVIFSLQFLEKTSEQASLLELLMQTMLCFLSTGILHYWTGVREIRQSKNGCKVNTDRLASDERPSGRGRSLRLARLYQMEQTVQKFICCQRDTAELPKLGFLSGCFQCTLT